MIEIEIPKDVRDFEAKLIGPFTARQLFCAIGLALGCYGSYKMAVNLFGEGASVNMLFPIVGAIPFAAVGWFKPYGMHFEKFARSVFVSMFLSPTKRLYKIDNTFDRFDKIIDAEEKAKVAQETGASKPKTSILKSKSS